MDFLKFLKDYENEDVTTVAKIVESNKAKENAIIKEAFNTTFASKKEALFNLTNYFGEASTAPKGIDVEYVKEHMDTLKEKISQLDEGDIRIIIHNHEGPGKGKGLGGVEMEEEGAKPKRKRGRPRKDDFTKAPKNTGVIYDEADPDIVNDMIADEEQPIEEPVKGDVVQTIGDEEIFDKIFRDIDDDENEEEKETIVDELKPSKLKWSNIVKKVEAKSLADRKDELVSELAKLNLDEEELKQATDMAESGEITEDDGPIGKGAGIISKIKSLK